MMPVLLHVDHISMLHCEGGAWTVVSYLERSEVWDTGTS